MKNKHVGLYFIVAFVFLSGFLPAYAYLDPGTGTMVIQVIVAVFTTIAIVIKACWNNIKIFFISKFGKK